MKCINEEKIKLNEEYKCKKCNCYLKYTSKIVDGKTDWYEVGGFKYPTFSSSTKFFYLCPKCGREYEE